MRLAVYPGSFDPITNGHMDVALRAAKLFDGLIVSIYSGTTKANALFDPEERIELAKQAFAESDEPQASRIRVESFSGLAVEYARSVGATTLVRGLRAVSDFEYEFKYAHMNNHIAPEIEVVCLMTSSKHSFISSSFIREVASLGGTVDGLVPPNIAAAVHRRVSAVNHPLPAHGMA
ncbi:MAG TPA: pantetheine-phosphate adenylyltransferase [Thermomicrobiales bacterium]|nr:pantetheine-phosphate adenylyltransferase [Thermomicrobiales bacterium]